MNYKALLLTLIGFMVIMTANGQLQDVSNEDQYMRNTYIYLFIGAAIVLMTTQTAKQDFGLQQYILSNGGAVTNLMLMFFCLIVVMSITDDKSMIKHFAWTTFMVCVGLFMYMNIIFSDAGTVKNSLLTTFVLFISLSWFAYRLQTQVMSQRYNLLFLLLCLIMFQIFYFNMSRNKNDQLTHQKTMGILTVALFSGFMIYDTQYIKSRQSMDYSVDSLSLGIDILNLFVGASVLYS